MIFRDVVLQYKGNSYKVKRDEVLRLIAVVEDIMSITKLINATKNKEFPAAKISQAYGAALRYAGCDVTDEDVYSDIFANTNSVEVYYGALNGLLSMMLPPDEVLGENEGEGTDEKKQ